MALLDNGIVDLTNGEGTREAFTFYESLELVDTLTSDIELLDSVNLDKLDVLALGLLSSAHQHLVQPILSAPRTLREETMFSYVMDGKGYVFVRKAPDSSTTELVVTSNQIERVDIYLGTRETYETMYLGRDDFSPYIDSGVVTIYAMIPNWSPTYRRDYKVDMLLHWVGMLFTGFQLAARPTRCIFIHDADRSYEPGGDINRGLITDLRQISANNIQLMTLTPPAPSSMGMNYDEKETPIRRFLTENFIKTHSLPVGKGKICKNLLRLLYDANDCYGRLKLGYSRRNLLPDERLYIEGYKAVLSDMFNPEDLK